MRKSHIMTLPFISIGTIFFKDIFERAKTVISRASLYLKEVEGLRLGITRRAYRISPVSRVELFD